MNWISVNERLPELIEGEDYSANVLAVENGVLRVMAYCYLPGEDGGFIWGNCYGDIDGDCEVDDEYEPTHWMPLPELPIK